MKLGNLIIENWKDSEGNRFFIAIILNKFGGSRGYADHSLLNIVLWLLNINRV